MAGVTHIKIEESIERQRSAIQQEIQLLLGAVFFLKLLFSIGFGVSAIAW